jgi:hypothetical protein
MSFPGGQESIENDCKIPFKISWIPALAGMTTEQLL